MTSALSLQERYAQAVRDDSGESFAALTEPDITLSGSVFAWPITGRAQVQLALRTASGIYDELTFTGATELPDRAYLEWSARGLGLEIHGVTAIATGQAGAFTSIALHHRPLGAVLAFSKELSRRLDGLIDPSHFDATSA